MGHLPAEGIEARSAVERLREWVMLDARGERFDEGGCKEMKRCMPLPREFRYQDMYQSRRIKPSQPPKKHHHQWMRMKKTFDTEVLD